jgi:hypothetical protein
MNDSHATDADQSSDQLTERTVNPSTHHPSGSPPGRSASITYRYPVAYRVQALLGALLFGLILLGSVIAEVEAIQNSRADAVLHLVGFVIGLAVLLLGLDFGTRAITTTADGLRVRWLRSSFVRWEDIVDWHYLPLNLIHIRLRHGPGLFLWPILERYAELLATIDEHRGDRITG